MYEKINHINVRFEQKKYTHTAMNSDMYFSVLGDELMTDKSLLSLNTELRKIPTWSSLNALLLVSRVNQEFGVMISAIELADLLTINDLFTLIDLKRNG